VEGHSGHAKDRHTVKKRREEGKEKGEKGKAKRGKGARGREKGQAEKVKKRKRVGGPSSVHFCHEGRVVRASVLPASVEFVKLVRVVGVVRVVKVVWAI
jgi:hypothetical protein